MDQAFIYLPPLKALRTFEAAARHSSFKRAADELCVTQAAVSRQIRSLEQDMGLELFQRSHRRVDLTEAGLTLFTTVNRSFTKIAETSRKIQQDI